ncbi:hypothetical protein LCGC14_0538140 [marine sediment metagenome]|uniref:Uncharacterized protein n=1 Tax=marine sediment metagenome TaxID=412755 RepID=A0A0F9UF21_9ZZZZ
MKRYIFDEWQPNMILMIITLLIYVYIIYIASIKISFLVLLVFLLFGWSISFSKPLKRNK